MHEGSKVTVTVETVEDNRVISGDSFKVTVMLETDLKLHPPMLCYLDHGGMQMTHMTYNYTPLAPGKPVILHLKPFTPIRYTFKIDILHHAHPGPSGTVNRRKECIDQIHWAFDVSAVLPE